MVWQDIVIAIASILFGYSLAYQVFRGFKEKKGFLTLQSSLITTIGLCAITIAYLSLKLYLSAIVAVFSGIMWFLLFIQRIIYKKV